MYMFEWLYNSTVVILASDFSMCSTKMRAKGKEIVTSNKDNPEEGNQGQWKSQKENLPWAP